MSPVEYHVSEKDIQSRYASLFAFVSELYALHYNQKPAEKLEDIKSATEKLKEDNHLSDYLYASLKALYDLHTVKMDIQEKADNLCRLLDIAIGDLCQEIKDLIEAGDADYREHLIKSLIG